MVGVLEIKKLGDNSYFIGKHIPIIYERNKSGYEITIDSNLWLIRFPLRMTIIGSIILAIVVIFNF